MAQVEFEEGQAMPVIPPVPRRWWRVKPCGTGAAYRRHLRHLRDISAGERYKRIDDACLAWHRQHWNDKAT